MIPHYNHISPHVSVDGARMINSGYDSTSIVSTQCSEQKEDE